MRDRFRSSIFRTKLFIEFLEDRTTPALFLDALASAVPIVGAPVDSINVVSTAGVENPAFQASLAAAPYATSVHHVGFGIYNVTLNSGIEPSAAATIYSSLPGVKLAEPDIIIQVNLTPNDTMYSSLYGMQKISAPTAWDVSTGSGNFVVAVIDTGADYTHPDLAANMWHNPAETPGDGVDNDGNGLIDDYYGANFIGSNSGNPFDDNGHGTHVTGILAAEKNGYLVVGVAPAVELYALKILGASGEGDVSNLILALQWCISIP